MLVPERWMIGTNVKKSEVLYAGREILGNVYKYNQVKMTVYVCATVWVGVLVSIVIPFAHSLAKLYGHSTEQRKPNCSIQFRLVLLLLPNRNCSATHTHTKMSTFRIQLSNIYEANKVKRHNSTLLKMRKNIIDYFMLAIGFMRFARSGRRLFNAKSFKSTSFCLSIIKSSFQINHMMHSFVWKVGGDLNETLTLVPINSLQ